MKTDKQAKIQRWGRVTAKHDRVVEEMNLENIPTPDQHPVAPMGFIDDRPRLVEVPKLPSCPDDLKSSTMIFQLISYLRDKDVDLKEYFEARVGRCGAVGCIAGWADELWGNTELSVYGDLALHLGISLSEAQWLGQPKGYLNPSKDAAIERMHQLALKYEVVGE